MKCKKDKRFTTSVAAMMISILCLVDYLILFSSTHRDGFRQFPMYTRIHSVTRTSNASKNASSGSLNSTATNHSNQNGVANQPLDYEIVISHYNENLDWAKPLAGHSHVYHKGKDKGPPFNVYKWEKLPNVGREAHTYLHHIIHIYDNLANITVFLQGTGTEDHRSSCFASPMKFVEQAKKHKYCKISWAERGWWGRIRHIGKWLKALQNGNMRKANLTMGEFYTALFGTKPPDVIPVCHCGCISASRKNLRRFPVSYFEKAISFVNDHSNPEEAHYFERLWATIINTK